MNNKLLYKGYSGTVNFSAESEVFYGKINGINDLVTFEGSWIDRSNLCHPYRSYCATHTGLMCATRTD